MIKKLILGFVVLGVVLFVFKNTLLSSALSFGATKALGTKVTVGTLDFSPFKGTVLLQDLKVMQPEGFEPGAMIDLKEARVELRVADLLKKSIYLNAIAIDLNQIVLIRNEQGVLNLDQLKVSQKKKDDSDKTESKETQSSPKSPSWPLYITELKVRFGSATHKDLSKGTNKVYELNIEKTFKNIKGVEGLVAAITIEVLKTAAIKGAGIYGSAALLGPVAIPVALLGEERIKQVGQTVQGGVKNLLSMGKNLIGGSDPKSSEEQAA